MFITLISVAVGYPVSLVEVYLVSQVGVYLASLVAEYMLLEILSFSLPPLGLPSSSLLAFVSRTSISDAGKTLSSIRDPCLRYVVGYRGD